MSPRFSKIIKYSLTGVVVAIFGFFIVRFHKELYILRETTLTQFLALLALVLAAIAVNGSKLRFLFRFFNLNLETKEWFGLSCITTSLNNIFFKAGSMVTSNYLKRKFDFPYMTFLGCLGADQLILFFICTVTGGIVSMMVSASIGGSLISISAVYFLLALVLFLVMKGTFRLKSRDNIFLDAVTRALKSLDKILKDRKLFFMLSAHNIALICLTSLRFYVVCHVLRLEVSLSYCLLFTTIMIFASTIPMVQSDVGTRELAIGIFSELVGVGFQQGLLATVVDRLFVLLPAIILTALFKNILLTSKTNEQRV